MNSNNQDNNSEPDHDGLSQGLDQYMKSLTDTFSQFENGLKRHETFGKRMLETISKANSQKLNIFEILKLLTQEVSQLHSGLDQTKKEISLLSSRGQTHYEKPEQEPIPYESSSDDSSDIYARSKQAFRAIDEVIDEKARPNNDQTYNKEWSQVELELSTITNRLESWCSRFREGIRIEQNHGKELMQTLEKVNARKLGTSRAEQDNLIIVTRLQEKLGIMREGLKAMPLAQGAGDENPENNELKTDLERKLDEGEKAVRLYRFKDGILKQKIAIYITESTNIEKELKEVKDKEQTLLMAYDAFLTRINSSIHVPDDIQKFLVDTKFVEEDLAARDEKTRQSPE